MLSSYYTSRAAALTKLKQYDEALEDCKLALEFDRNAIKAYQRQARIYMLRGMLGEAVETYERASKVDPQAVVSDRKHTETTIEKYENAKVVIDRERTAKSSDNKRAIQKAKEDLKTILKFCPEWDEARVLETEALFYSGDVDEAYQLASCLVKDGLSRNPDLLLLRAKLMLKKGRLDDAVKQLGVLMTRFPTFQRAKLLNDKVDLIRQLMDQGDESYASKDYQRAIRYYATAIDSCPDHAEGMVAKLKFSRSAVNASIGAHNLAIEDYADVIKYDPSHVKAYYRQGASFLALKTGDRMKNCQFAVRSLQTALDLCQSPPLEDDIKVKLSEALSELTKKKFVSKDYFAVLGLRKTASLGEVYSAYRMRSLRLHNLKHSATSPHEIAEAEREYQEISEAYHVLSEALKSGFTSQYTEANTVRKNSMDGADTDDPTFVLRSELDRRMLVSAKSIDHDISYCSSIVTRGGQFQGYPSGREVMANASLSRGPKQSSFRGMNPAKASPEASLRRLSPLRDSPENFIPRQANHRAYQNQADHSGLVPRPFGYGNAGFAGSPPSGYHRGTVYDDSLPRQRDYEATNL
jgi:DnaJ homolog subfamily C member 7